MPLDTTPAEGARAQLLVFQLMLEELWITELGRWGEPIEEALAIERSIQAKLDELGSKLKGRDAEVTQHVAGEYFSTLWGLIVAELRAGQEPLAIVPTEHGLAQYRAARTRPEPRRKGYRWPRS